MRTRTTIRRRVATVLAALALGLAATTATAWAHVTISPDTAAKGASDLQLTFRVPNEEAAADTTELQVYFPVDDPIASVLVEPTPGWTETVTTIDLATPIVTDDGSITQVVSSITWTGGQIKPGQYQGFNVIFGQLPTNTGQIVFKALQTYSNGDVVRWIDLTVPGQPDPAHPAPVLALTQVTESGAASVLSDGPAGSTEFSGSASDSTTRGLAVGALALGALGAWLGTAGLLRTRRNWSFALLDRRVRLCGAGWAGSPVPGR